MFLPIAQAGPALFGGSMLPLFAAMFLVMYFTMIRPQAKAAKAHRSLVEGLRRATASSRRAASTARSRAWTRRPS